MKIIAAGSCLAFALMSVASTACGGGNGSGAATSTPAAVASVIPTAVPTPVVSGDHVNSTGVGYEARVPADWRLHPNIITAANFRGDAYFKPDPSPAPDPNKPTINISAGCQPIVGTPGDYQTELNAHVDVLNRLGRTNLRVSDHLPVDGLQASLVDYTQDFKQGETELIVDRREVFFVSAACRWTIALTAPAGQIEDSAAVLEQFLSSFKVIG